MAGAARPKVQQFAFRRQHPIGPYILDFFCTSARIAIEIDGAAHDTAERARHDECREAWLAQHGITVMRFMASDVLKDERLEGVLMAILEAAANPVPAPLR